MRGVQVTLSEVAYIIKSCEYLLSELQDVERTLERVEEMDPLQDSMLETEATQASGAIKGQLDHAARVAEHWHATIRQIVP